MEFRDIEKLLKYKKKLFSLKKMRVILKSFRIRCILSEQTKVYILKHFGHNSI